MLVYPQVCGAEYVQPRPMRKITGSDGYLAKVGSWLKSGFV
jgi:cell division protein FtsA